MPPRIVRRLLCTPFLFLLTGLVVVAFPFVWMLGSERVVRFLWFALAWGVRESAAVVECFWLWCTGRGHDERHYEVIRRYVGGLYSVAERRLGLRVEDEGSWEGAGKGRPLIVLSRHAGPGDALILVHHLLSGYGRRPRVVMKAQLQLDPCIDIAANRMPNVFVRRGGATERVGRLAEGLGPRDALLIFPEGGNFSPERRHRAIRRLARHDRRRDVARASRMRNLMPPRPGGVLAAIDAAPGADVVFVAHVGLDRMATVGDIWRRVPLAEPVRARWWRIPAEDVPDGREARINWLYAQWERADAWIGAMSR